MRSRRLLAAASTALLAMTMPALAEITVVASIKPVHSLVAGVMEGVGEPGLIVGGAGSPHSYAMRPSEAGALQDARLVFWIGEGLETFLVEPLKTLAGDARIVELSEVEGLTLLHYREAGPGQDHDGHDHEQHDHEGHDHDHEGEAHHDHDHVHHGMDMHLWLDPENARMMVGEIAQALSEADPDNAETYRRNAAALQVRLDELTAQTQAALAEVRDRPFVVFHDAYQYFEERFGIEAAGSITVSPEAIPGARRVAEIRERIEELGATCVFSEPQFEPQIVSTLIEGTDARAAELDPLGAALEDGPDLYFELISGLTTSLTECLSQE